jgi:hypothetical protein
MMDLLVFEFRWKQAAYGDFVSLEPYTCVLVELFRRNCL